ncbi:MAG: zinc ribbon domain-containing protein [Oscillospiraceae bacterium]|nr:zinc ribbon domain-containing protein [Oscillospiraceae bacterium]
MDMMMYRCAKCGKLHHPAYYVCQECGSREFTGEPLKGKCTLLTYTRVHNLPSGYSQPWLNFGIVRFENGLTAAGRIEPDDLQIGMELVSSVGVVKEGSGKDEYGFIFKKAEPV